MRNVGYYKPIKATNDVMNFRSVVIGVMEYTRKVEGKGTNAGKSHYFEHAKSHKLILFFLVWLTRTASDV